MAITKEGLKSAQQILVELGAYKEAGIYRNMNNLAEQIRREVDGNLGNDPEHSRTVRAQMMATIMVAKEKDPAKKQALDNAISTITTYMNEQKDVAVSTKIAAAAPAAPAPARAATTPSAQSDASSHAEYEGERFKVRGNGRNAYDTVATIAAAALRANPGSGLSLAQATQKIIDANHIHDKNGVDCAGKPNSYPLIKPGDKLDLRVIGPKHVSDFDLVHGREDCTRIGLPAVPRGRNASSAPTPSVAEIQQAEIVNLNSPAPLVRLPSQGTPNFSDVYTAANMPMLMGVMPLQPEVAARGHNPNTVRVQTPRDIAENVLDIAIPTGIVLAQAAVSPVAFVPFHIGSGEDSAARLQPPRAGSNGQRGNQDRPHDPGLLNVDRQWLANGDFTINPLRNGRTEDLDSILLPGVGLTVTRAGQVVNATRPDGRTTEVPNNELHTTGIGAPATVTSDKYATTGERNNFSWNPASISIPLHGLNSYSLAELANRRSIQPQLEQANTEFDRSPSRENAQRVIGLLNYQSTLSGVVDFPVDRNHLNPKTMPEVASMNPAERIAFNRNRFVAHAEALGVRGLDVNYIPAETPLRSIPKAELRQKMIGYYDEFTKDSSNHHSFNLLYGLDEMGGQPNRYNMSDNAQRRKAVETFVDNMPMIRDYSPNGVPLQSMDRLVSNRSTYRPTDVRETALNRYEQGEFEPKARLTGQAATDAMTQTMKLIGNDMGATSLVLGAAGYNRDVAQVLVRRDQLSVQVPREMTDAGFLLTLDRRTSRDEIAKRGYPAAAMETLFATQPNQGIMRGDVDAAGRSIAANGGDLNGEQMLAVQGALRQTSTREDVVNLRRQDLINMSTDGMRNDPRFPKGALQVQFLDALATERGTERGNETLRRIEARLRANAENPDQAVETFRQALDAATNLRSLDTLGRSRDDRRDDVAIQTVMAQTLRAEAAGIVSQPAISSGAVGANNSQRPAPTPEQLNQHTRNYNTVAGNARNSQSLINNLSRMPVAEQALTQIMVQEDRPQDRVTVARAALTAVNNNPSARATLLSSFANEADKTRFEAITARALTSDDAAFVLDAVNTNAKPHAYAARVARPSNAPGLDEVRSTAMQGVAADANASRALTRTIAAFQMLGDEVSQGLQTAGVNTAPAAAPTRRATAAPTTQSPVQYTGVNTPVARAAVDASRQGSAGVAAVAFTQGNALNAYVARDQSHAALMAMQTIAANPALYDAVNTQMREKGRQRDASIGSSIFNDNAQTDLMEVVRDYGTAVRTGNQQSVDKAKAALTNFMSGTKDAESARRQTALTDLVNTTVGVPQGRDAYLTTIGVGSTTATPEQNRLLIEAVVGSGFTNPGITGANVGITQAGVTTQTTLAGLPAIPGLVVPGILTYTGHHDKPHRKPPTPTPTPTPTPPVPTPPVPTPTPVTPIPVQPVPGCGTLMENCVAPPVPVVPPVIVTPPPIVTPVTPPIVTPVTPIPTPIPVVPPTIVTPVTPPVPTPILTPRR